MFDAFSVGKLPLSKPSDSRWAIISVAVGDKSLLFIRLLDKNNHHLAFVACQNEKVFPLYDLANDREESHFLEEISNFEAEILLNYFQIDGEKAERFGGRTGEFIITDKNGEIFYRERSASK